MALRELPFRTAFGLCREVRPSIQAVRPSLRRNASAPALQEVEDSSFAVPQPSADIVKAFDPIARSKLMRRRTKQLPASRYSTPKAQGRHQTDST